MNLFAGSYTEMITPDFGGHGRGVYSFRFDPVHGEVSRIGEFSIVNPSYLSVFNDNLYTFNEISLEERPFLHAYKIDENNQLILINKVPIDGAYPCHISYSVKFQCLFVSCYGSGNVLVYPFNNDGSVEPSIQNIRHSGSSVNRLRQESSHVHFVVVSDQNDEIFVADLGVDKIMIYGLKKENDKIEVFYKDCMLMPEGSGPRHLSYEPYNNYLFVLAELTAEVFLIHVAARKIIRTIKLLPDDPGITPAAAAIKISNDGRFIYASERTSNRIFTLEFDQKNLHLKLIDSVDSNVVTPRDFLLDATGNWLIAAGQDSDSLAIFKRDVLSGRIHLHKVAENFNSVSCLV